MAELPAPTIRLAEPGDAPQVLAAFNRVFAAVDPTFQPRSPAAWRWQFEEIPAGCRIWLAIAPDGQVVAAYPVVLQRMRLDGEQGLFSQSIDSMSDPAYRRGLGKIPLFVQVVQAYIAAGYGGPPPEGFTLMWGLPVPAAWRIGKKYLLYEALRTQQKLVADEERLAALAELPDGGIDVAEVAEVPADVEPLFERAAAGRRAIAIRDHAWLTWRYLRHPERRYALLAARRGGELAGLAVARAGHFDGERAELVCDWLVPAGDDASRRALAAALARRALAGGEPRLAALFPDTAPEWLAFQRLGFRVRPTRYMVVGCSWVRRFSIRWCYRHWYYTLGDTDLV
jgi:hypothetical protein